MTYLVIIFAIILIGGLLYYNNKLRESFEGEGTDPRLRVSEPEPSVSKANHSEPAEYTHSQTQEEADNKPVLRNPLTLYKAYMDTNCKNNSCCADGMTFSEELGVCIKNNDSSYLSEFHALGTTPVSPPNVDDLR
jgi:hypothetical protein